MPERQPVHGRPGGREKADKEDVDYSEGMGDRRCGRCVHWLPDGPAAFSGACALVKGHILARMWCELFKRR